MGWKTKRVRRSDSGDLIRLQVFDDTSSSSYSSYGTSSGSSKRGCGGCGRGCLLIIIVFFVFCCFASENENDALEYWNGDRNCPIFVHRQNNSMVAFKLDTAKEIRDKTSNDKSYVFRGYEINPDGSFYADGYLYGIVINKEKEYIVVYPPTPNFPDGYTFVVENEYQIKVCKKIAKASSKNESH